MIINEERSSKSVHQSINQSINQSIDIAHWIYTNTQSINRSIDQATNQPEPYLNSSSTVSDHRQSSSPSVSQMPRDRPYWSEGRKKRRRVTARDRDEYKIHRPLMPIRQAHQNARSKEKFHCTPDAGAFLPRPRFSVAFPSDPTQGDSDRRSAAGNCGKGGPWEEWIMKLISSLEDRSIIIPTSSSPAQPSPAQLSSVFSSLLAGLLRDTQLQHTHTQTNTRNGGVAGDLRGIIEACKQEPTGRGLRKTKEARKEGEGIKKMRR